MSGTNKPTATAPAAGSEPSMDDILASIRKILNDDGTAGPDQHPLPEPPPEPLMLTEAMLVAAAEPAPPAPEPEPAPPAPVLVAEPAAPAPPPTPSLAPEPPAMPNSELLAPAAVAATAASVSELLRAVSQERTAAVTRSGPSIEDVVREEIRPILKEWLDTHLPAIVERTVRQEIERVVNAQR